MKIRVILYCIFLSAITFVGCDKQEDDILVSAVGDATVSVNGVSNLTPISTFDYSYPTTATCLSGFPFVLAGHTYLDLSEHYDLSFSIARNRDYNGEYKMGGLRERSLSPDYEFVNEIIWTVSNPNSLSNNIYYGPNFSHTFLHREEYSINCKVSLLNNTGNVYERSYDFCIVRNTRDEGINIPNRLYDFVEWVVPSSHLNGGHTPVQYTCGNFQNNLCCGENPTVDRNASENLRDILCDNGGNSLISVLP